MAGEKVTLDFVDWRYDEWTFKVEGTDYSIKKGGTEVPQGRADAIEQAAYAEGIELKKV